MLTWKQRIVRNYIKKLQNRSDLGWLINLVTLKAVAMDKLADLKTCVKEAETLPISIAQGLINGH